jgi:hypothetical protein
MDSAKSTFPCAGQATFWLYVFFIKCMFEDCSGELTKEIKVIMAIIRWP